MQVVSNWREIDKYVKEIEALPEQVRQASLYALNRTAGWVKNRIAEKVSAEHRIKLNVIRKRIKIVRAKYNNLNAILELYGSGIYPEEIGRVRQTREGVIAGGHLFKHAFIKKIKRRHYYVHRRTTKDKYPLEYPKLNVFSGCIDIVSNLLGNEACIYFENRFYFELKRLAGYI